MSACKTFGLAVLQMATIREAGALLGSLRRGALNSGGTRRAPAISAHLF
jgi:hypothetical protein